MTRVIYFDRFPFKDKTPRWSAIHGAMLDLHHPEWPNLFPKDQTVPIPLIVNVAAKYPVLWYGPHMAVGPEVLKALREVAVFQTIPVRIVGAFDYPVRADDYGYRDDPAYVHDTLANRIVRRFYEKYQCPVPSDLRMDLIDCFHLHGGIAGYSDRKKVSIHDRSFEYVMSDCDVSPTCLHEYGIVRSNGHWCLEHVWERIGSLFTEDMFYRCKVHL